MKKVILILLTVCLTLALLAGCGGNETPGGNGGDTPPVINGVTEKSDANPSRVTPADGEETPDDDAFATIQGIADEYERLFAFSRNSEAFQTLKMDTNLTLSGSVMSFANGAMYGAKNYENIDGEFGSKEDGYLKKSGSLYTFGKETQPAAEDGFGVKKGDMTATEGTYDGKNHIYTYKNQKENGGVVLYRNHFFAQITDNGIVVLDIAGAPTIENTQSYTKYAFSTTSEDKYAFVYAKSDTLGADFEEMTFDPGKSIEEIKKAFEDLGLTVFQAGTIDIKNDTFTPLT